MDEEISRPRCPSVLSSCHGSNCSSVHVKGNYPPRGRLHACRGQRCVWRSSGAVRSASVAASRAAGPTLVRRGRVPAPQVGVGVLREERSSLLLASPTLAAAARDRAAQPLVERPDHHGHDDEHGQVDPAEPAALLRRDVDGKASRHGRESRSGAARRWPGELAGGCCGAQPHRSQPRAVLSTRGALRHPGDGILSAPVMSTTGGCAP